MANYVSIKSQVVTIQRQMGQSNLEIERDDRFSSNSVQHDGHNEINDIANMTNKSSPNNVNKGKYANASSTHEFCRIPTSYRNYLI
ncbi:hypothetical protein Glove_155g113 [Diversispora epigaea]|uniref:Uncharacterized protein n=1 Tax=Diversispora epigaea TaxID=1348612 RepID=A0A397ISD5_9GLOM|nr:hypothetical protein Glove_155g113 [Diversispora epigaea]